MSRLEDFTNRFISQAAAINRAAELIKPIDGIVVELGLGKGRTFDHLRERLPDREIYVFDRELSCEREFAPPPEYWVFGEIRETLPDFCAKHAGHVAFVHSDVGTRDRQSDMPLTNFVIAQLELMLTRKGAILASDRPMPSACWEEHEILPEFSAWRYYLYRSLGH